MVTTVLLVESALTAHDVDRLAHLHDPDPVRVHVLVPVGTAHNRLVEALDDVALGRLREAVSEPDAPPPEEAETAARHAVDSSVAALRAAGVDAEGATVPADPVDAVSEAVTRICADEIVVVTEPHLVEEALHRDWASRLRDRVHLPVLHVVAGTDRIVG